MNEEEKEAIDYFKEVINLYEQGLRDIRYLDDMHIRMTVLINLIDKQQKEIEEQNKEYIELDKECREKTTIIMAGAEKVKQLEEEIERLKVLEDDIQNKNIAYIDEPEFEEKYISKDKIREKIEKYQKDIEKINDKAPKRKDGKPNERYNHENREYFINKQKALIELL